MQMQLCHDWCPPSDQSQSFSEHPERGGRESTSPPHLLLESAMKTVIEMAREAGWDEHHAKLDLRLERFAALVREDEREQNGTAWPQLLEAAVLAEREACAKVCEELWKDWCGKEYVSAAIRARGEE